MLSSHPFQEQQLDKPIAQHMFGFFNVRELSEFTKVCNTWNNFIENDFFKSSDVIAAKPTAELYQKFKFYYSEKGFILDVDTSDFFIENRETMVDVLNPEIAKQLAFIQPCLDVSGLGKFNMYFWSADGMNFHLMQEKYSQSCNNEKTSSFATCENSINRETNCRIKFTDRNAILLENEIIDKKRTFTNCSIVLELNLDNYTPPPPPKELMAFTRCPQKFEELLLQFILANKINMHVFKSQLKPLLLFKDSEDNLLFIGEQYNKRILKIKQESQWNDLRPHAILISSDGLKSMQITFGDDSDIQVIKISNPHSNAYKAYMQMDNGKRIDFTKIDVDANLAQLNFLNITENPRPTPLDIFAESKTFVPQIN